MQHNENNCLPLSCIALESLCSIFPEYIVIHIPKKISLCNKGKQIFINKNIITYIIQTDQNRVKLELFIEKKNTTKK